MTVTTKVSFSTSKAGKKKLKVQEAPAANVPQGRVPRISKLMALAIRFERLLREGKVADLSELARLAKVSQPRMTQIMNLNHLAPDIQEKLLFLPLVEQGRDGVTERDLRPVVQSLDWRQQLQSWRILTSRVSKTRTAKRVCY